MRKWLLGGAVVTSIVIGVGGFFALGGEGLFAVRDSVEGCPAALFDRRADVFGAIRICATPRVSDEKLRHAANVAAEWIDNDGDGNADAPEVLVALSARPAILVMSERGFNAVGYAKIMPAIEALGGVGQDLSAEETARVEGRDASQEEIHHLLIAAGWAAAYPQLFSPLKADASVAYRQWAYAEAQGAYSYGDPTCDHECKAMEFMYLSTAAYLGSEADVASDEMRVKTRVAMVEALPEMVALFENGDYAYPKYAWPDGIYPHRANVVFTPPQ